MDAIGEILIVTIIAVVCATRGGLFALLCLDLACASFFSGEWYIGSLSLDGADIVIVMIVLLLLRGVRPAEGIRLRDVPGLKLWFILGLWACAAYLASPVNADRLTDPLRVGYQLYRYCWKPILMYPLVCVFVGTNSRHARTLLLLILALGCLTAVTTVGTYFLGHRGPELLDAKNKFAGSLIAPAIACFALLLSVPGGRRRLMLLAGFGVLGTGLVAAGSRGAIVAAGIAGGALVAGLSRFAGGRRRLAKLGGWAAVGLFAFLLVGPDLSSLPGFKLLSELQRGTQVDNLVWRMQERWPHFWNKLMTSPWLGLGTDRDLSLADHANTPHNGYLSLALLRGIPAAVIMIFFGFRAILTARRTFRLRGDTRIRLLALGVAAALGGLLVHNMAESTLSVPYVGKLYWLLVALGTMSPLLSMDEARSTIPETARLRRTGRIPVRPLAPTAETPLP